MQHDEAGAELANPYAAPPLLQNDTVAAVNDADVPAELKPFRTIWTRPRATIRWIVATDPKLHVVLLVCLSGIGETLDRASMRNAGDQLPLSTILGIALVLGPLAGLIGLWISSHLIRLAGAWMGGVAPREHIKAAIAWSSVPAIVAMVLWIPQIVLFGSDMFTTHTPRLDAQPELWAVLLGIALVEMTLGIWSFILLCKTIAEVQGFRSAWRGFANIFFAGALIIVPLFAIVFGLLAIAGLGGAFAP